jgi:hypothetical protein
MKTSIILCISLVALASSGTLQWPTGPVGTRNDTRTLLNTYGSPNNSWCDVYYYWYYSGSDGIVNFHSGIDIKQFSSDPLIEDDEVYPIESGYFIDVPYDISVENSDGSRTDGVHYTIGASQVSAFGWCYQHLLFSTNPIWEKYQPILTSVVISEMDPALQTDHTHLMWADAAYSSYSGGFDPLNELRFVAHSGYPSAMVWNWRQDRYDLHIIPQYEDGIASWYDVTSFEAIEIDKDNVSGPVDILLEYYLEALGQYPDPTFSSPSDDHSVTPQKIEWSVSRETISGTVEVFSRKVMNFDVEDLGGDTYLLEYLLHYFKITEPESPFPDQGDQEGVCCCLTNCGDEQSFTNLGLTNIEENCWQTNGFLGSEGLAGSSTINPILQETPDGEYSISVTSYAYNDMDSDTYVEDGIILRNFHPALREVSIIDLETEDTYYHAEWVPDVSGLEAVLDVDQGPTAPAGAELQVILVFTEEMDTNSLSADLGPLDITYDSWSGSVVPNDTWTGEVTLPEEMTDGNYTLLVSASDTDDNDLMDPEGAGTVPTGPYYDCHHALSLDFAAGVEWTRSLHDEVMGSPKLADIDLDGDLDVVVQCADGWVDVLDDDGTSMSGWPVSGGWSPGDPNVWACPAIVNLSGVSSSAPEILAVHPYGCNGFMATGSAISDWHAILPAAAEFFALSSPAAGDFDGDGDNDFAMGRESILNPVLPFPITFLARNSAGSHLWNSYNLWGEDESVSATPSLSDVNNDNSLDVLV